MMTQDAIVPFRRFRFAGGITVEVAQFVLAPGTTEAALVDASNRMQRAFAGETGFLGRLLTQDDRGTYLDILYWAEDAERLPTLAQRAERSPACADYLACLAAPEGGEPPVDALIRGVAATASAARMKS